MAVEETRQAIAKYWPRYRSHALFVIISTQIVVLLATAIALIVWQASGNEATLWAILGGAALGIVAFTLIAFSFVTAPLKAISQALIQATEEESRSETTIAAPATAAPLLEAVKELSTKQHEEAVKEQEESAKPTLNIESALDETVTGIVLIKDGQIIYSNKNAPVKPAKNDQGLELDLIFDGETPLAEWIKECEKQSIRAEKVWLRIPTRIPGDEDRRIYDIYASYEKSAEVDAVVTLVERTAQYQPDDDDLDFIAFAAHELRGPVTVIRGYLDTLGAELDERFIDDERQLFDRLVVSANRLSSYINNILNAAKYDRRHLKVYLGETKVSTIYDTIKDDMELRAVSQNRLLSVTFPEDLPTVAADLASIGEVLGNLIDNALKYSNEGGTVTVSAARTGDSVEISVIDKGIGMPSNVVSNLFHKFYRSHRSRETVAGTGIGLYICKAIVESHGGTISVRSVEDEGSTFSFTLPVYSTVADKLKDGHNTAKDFTETHEGWIKNHGVTRV